MTKLVAFLLSIPLVVGGLAILVALVWGWLSLWGHRKELFNYRVSLKEIASFLLLFSVAILMFLAISAQVSEILMSL